MPTWGEPFFDSSFIVPIQGLCPALAELASHGECPSAARGPQSGKTAIGFRTTANCMKTAGTPLYSHLMTATNKKQLLSTINRQGFTLVEMMIVVSLIGLLAAIAVPSFLRSRNAAHRSNCINNLKQIDSAIQLWATEYHKPQSAPVNFSDISPYLKGAVVCPSGGTSFSDSYIISTVADLPVCQKVPQSHVWLGSAFDIARSAP
jgi:prepilin-type N-terminal cleavage/methylation domain-containing protein